MPTDIFEFWRRVAPNAHEHPADSKIFARVKNHGFDLKTLPGCFMGPLRTAPVVLLFLSPGLSEEDRPSPARIEWHAKNRSGNEPLVSEALHAPAYQWWKQRTKCFECEAEKLASNVAILNIGAYHSKTFRDHGLLAALPSSRAVLDWAQSTLFPAAEAGDRVVICLRAAKYWGLQSGKNYEGTSFAPNVTRSGHMHKKDRNKIVAAVKRAIQA
jgi:hypothetical protein